MLYSAEISKGVYTIDDWYIHPYFYTVRDWQGRGLTNYIFLGSKNNNLSAARLITLVPQGY